MIFGMEKGAENFDDFSCCFCFRFSPILGSKLEAKRLPKRLQKGLQTALRGFLAPRGSQKDSKTSLGVPKLSKNVPKSCKIDPKSSEMKRKINRKRDI